METLTDQNIAAVARTYALKGVTGARQHLLNLGVTATADQIRTLFDALKATGTALAMSDIPDLGGQVSSASLLVATAYAQAACCGRLQRIAVESGSYRVEAVLSEALGRLHAQLTEVDF